MFDVSRNYCTASSEANSLEHVLLFQLHTVSNGAPRIAISYSALAVESAEKQFTYGILAKVAGPEG
jgi:hypothetical protein